MQRRLVLATMIALTLLGLARLAPATAQPLERRLYLPAIANIEPGNPEDITIIEVFASEDGDDPGGEYIALFKNVDEPIDIGGWQVINASRSDRPTYTFPSYVADEDNLVYLYTDEGVRDPTIGDFYWGLDASVWSVGDVAELRDPGNRLIHSYTVFDPNEEFSTATPTTTTPPLPQPSPTTTTPPLPQPSATATLPNTPAPTSTSTAPPPTPSTTTTPSGAPAPTGTSTAPPSTPTRDPAVCAAEYPTVCIPPPPPDLDCGEIAYRFFTVLPPDRHRFDSDNDGVGCESE